MKRSQLETRPPMLSVVIPCYNEEATLTECVGRVLDIAGDDLRIEIVIVDDFSTDDSVTAAERIVALHPEVTLLRHSENQGKGAALRTGFAAARGDYVAVQDADLEYRPSDLRRLVQPLIDGDADVVFGSRFLSSGAHRVLYFWHSLGNRLLTLLSNMFTDLNLTDMETCYKVFRREVLQKVSIEENRFGFEPEIVAKISQQKVRVFEMGISYFGRTYAEGKKIGWRDGLRALYCVVRYNAYNAPLALQLMVYLLIGSTAALTNLLLFLVSFELSSNVAASTLLSFFAAAGLNYYLCIKLLFRHEARWSAPREALAYTALVCAVAVVDYGLTRYFLALGLSAAGAKIGATAGQMTLNFLGRRYLVFPESRRQDWKPQGGANGPASDAGTADTTAGNVVSIDQKAA